MTLMALEDPGKGRALVSPVSLVDPIEREVRRAAQVLTRSVDPRTPYYNTEPEGAGSFEELRSIQSWESLK